MASFGVVVSLRLLLLPLVGKREHLTLVVVVPPLPHLVLAIEELLLVGQQVELIIVAQVVACKLGMGIPPNASWIRLLVQG